MDAQEEIVCFIPETIGWPACPKCGVVLMGEAHVCTPWVFRRRIGGITILPDEHPIWCLRGFVPEEDKDSAGERG